jgi:hypothetical protein
MALFTRITRNKTPLKISAKCESFVIGQGPLPLSPLEVLERATFPSAV